MSAVPSSRPDAPAAPPWWQAPAFVVPASAAAILLVGLADALSGPDLSVLTFYFFPVLFSTWFVSRAAGIAMSLAAGAEWVAIDLLFNGGHVTHFVSAWNAAIHLAFFVLGVWAVGTLKGSMEERERVERERSRMEMETAREVQRALLPKERDLHIPGFELAASSEPALGISGDLYEANVDDGRLLLALGDVSGKGIPAALLGASLLAGLRSLAPLHRGRVDLLVAELNAMLQKASPRIRYATLFVAEYEFATATMRWVNAGHVAGLLLRRGREAPERLVSTGTVVGLFPGGAWTQNEERFEPGDTLLLFSDGVTEAMDGAEREFGEERIVDELARVPARRAQAIHDALLGAVTRFTGAAPLADDRTIVVLRREGAAATARGRSE